ncbi:SAM-dependent methyltransferase [Streptomyces cinnamoneus]|uniref:SAM-dependent methyltransferase n=1 Tax=Streptomyces cinnamoneus TaxID=53446 RepID=A0A2G1XJS3_STRCJ|nr:methyltransferase domain-containing protein [Streptomyces cinnamoneus]PHQ51476.1 SAM-dependent methyltransferase [Streptomyces cinnamoneus]PPT11658.1 methyltransferase domain-containing protein [Streptomyces cinnamoneus]
MGDRYVPHAFSHIDAHPNPVRLVDALYRLRAEPFFASYKRRLRQLLQAQPGQRFLDVGAGTGDAARELAAETGAETIACDLSQTMCAEMKRAGLEQVVVADSHCLPFQDAGFDGVWADRVLQHVESPARTLDEMVRVTRPGGRIVVCDPDTATQALDIDDHRLASKVLGLRQSVSIRHGTFARRVPGLLTARGLLDVEVEPHTLVIRDKRAVDGTMGIRDWADVFADRGHLDRSEARRFNALLDDAVEGNRFLYAVTYFLTSATVPTVRTQR